MWSGGATRWDSEVFEVSVSFVDCRTRRGVFAVSRVFEDYDGVSGSLTGMRCAVVSRRSGIILTTTTTFFESVCVVRK